jgi:type IV secretory pathway VirB2 component (pilin)
VVVRLKKIISALSMSLILLYTSPVYALIISDPDVKQLELTRVQKIIGYLQWIGFIIAVLILILYGIKYVMATANEKADLKGGFIKYLIGAVLIAGASTIAGWMFGLY